MSEVAERVKAIIVDKLSVEETEVTNHRLHGVYTHNNTCFVMRSSLPQVLYQNPSFPYCNVWNGQYDILLSASNQYRNSLHHHPFQKPFFLGLHYIGRKLFYACHCIVGGK